MNKIYLSIIIPAYNEALRIGTTLVSIEKYLCTRHYSYEVIVVDDGSSDETSLVVRSLKNRMANLKLITFPRNQGKGCAVQAGMKEARGEYRLFMDADNSVTIDNLDRFLGWQSAGFDVVIGSIETSGASVKEHNQSYRRILGSLSKIIIRLLAVPGIRDSQRGFKLFSKRAAELIFRNQTIKRFGFDIELLVLARLHRFPIKEVPVQWINPKGSTVTPLSYITTFRELIRIKLNVLSGVYRVKSGEKVSKKVSIIAIAKQFFTMHTVKALKKILFLSLAALVLLPHSAEAFTVPAGFNIVPVVTNLVLPTHFVFTPDGRMFIAEKSGRVRVFKNGVLLPTPLLTLPNVNTYGDRGLLGMALDPNFSQNGYIYLSYTYENDAANPTLSKTGRIVRVTVAGDTAPLASLVTLVGTVVGDASKPSCENFAVTADCVPSDSVSHSMGDLVFGPDGKLYASLGDGSSFDNVDQRAYRVQNIDSLSGKILRINTDGSALSDNPFYDGNANSNRSKVFAYGFRNAFRFTFRPNGKLYIGDVGWYTWEEINVGVKGGNFGWPCREGLVVNPGGYSCTAPNYVNPVYAYGHDSNGAGSIIGGPFYSASVYPSSYQGSYYFADFSQNWIKKAVFNSSDALVSVEDFVTGADGPVHMEVSPDGLIYYIAIYKGEIRKITYASGNRPPTAIMTAVPSSGLAPLSVSFSGAPSTDPDNDFLSYAWNFGDNINGVGTSTSHVYSSNGTYTSILTVSDGKGAASTTKIITVGNRAPAALINNPPTESFYIPGQFIPLEGSATDPEDSVFPDSAFSWQLILHHNTHIHMLETLSGRNPSFIAPDHTDTDVYLEVALTVTDSGGLADTKSINLRIAPPTAVDPHHVLSVMSSGTLVLGNPLTFTSTIKNLGSPDPFLIDLEIFSGSIKVGQTFYDNQTIPTNATRDFTINWTPPAAGDYRLAVGLLRTGWQGLYEWTNQALAFTVTNAAPPSATNLVPNPSVETVSSAKSSLPAFWLKGGSGTNTRILTYPVSGHSGAKGVKAEITSYTSGDAKWYPDYIPVTAGKKYAFSGWYQSNVSSFVTLQLKQSNGTFKYFDLKKNLAAAPTWQKYDGEYVVPAGTSAVSVFHLIKAVGFITIDDVDIHEASATSSDTTNPTVSLTSPNTGTVEGSIILAANATDNVSVLGVQFILDGNPVGLEDTSAPYSMSLDTNTLTNGVHAVTAKARDTSNNSSTSLAVSITVSNAESFTGGALQFDGVNDYVDVGDWDIEEDQGFTYETRFRPDSFAHPMRILSKSFGLNEQDYFWELALGSGSTTAPIIFRVKTTDGVTSTLQAGTVNIHEMATVAVVFDSTSMKIYKNGTLLGSLPKTGITAQNRSALVWIGGNPPVSTSGAFQGLIDDIRVWNKPHGQAELAATQGIDLVGNEIGLIKYWKFNEGFGQDVIDNSNSGHHGILGSSPSVDGNDPVWIGGSPTNPSGTFQPAIVSVTATPASTTPGNPVSVNALIKNQGDAAGYFIVDIEVYDGAGTKVGQKYYDGVRLDPAETRSFLYSFSTVGIDNYRVAVGLMKLHWTSAYAWNNDAARFSISNGTTPAFVLYADALNPNWSSWSWDTTVDFADATTPFEGTKDIKVTYTAAWGGLYLRTGAFDTTGYGTFSFAINGGSAGGQNLSIVLFDQNGSPLYPSKNVGAYVTGGISASTWKSVRIPLSDLQGSNRIITGFVIQGASGFIEPSYRIDSLKIEN